MSRMTKAEKANVAKLFDKAENEKMDRFFDECFADVMAIPRCPRCGVKHLFSRCCADEKPATGNIQSSHRKVQGSDKKPRSL
jgi:hypothetical protein